VNAGDSATKTIHITVNLLPVDDETIALRSELCKRPNYRYHPTCQELALSQLFSQAADLSGARKPKELASTSRPLVSPHSVDGSEGVEELPDFARMEVMLTSSDALDGDDRARRANFLSGILELEPKSALEMAQDNELFIDESTANTRVTIIGI
jgi:hypothetical protein